MKKILIPVDFSVASMHAASFGVQLAARLQAKPVLLYCYQLPVTDPITPTMLISPTELQEIHENSLKEASAKLENTYGIKVDYLAKIGFPADQIQDEEEGVQLVVMGMKGSGPVSEAIFGSTTTDVIRRTRKPVLIVPENAEFKGFSKIVYACDYDPQTAAKTMDPLKDLIRVFHSDLLILNVVNDETKVSLDEAKAGLKLEHKFEDVNHSYHFMTTKNLVQGVNDFAREQQADLIAIVPHRHNLIERLFHESNTKKLAFHTDFVILALPDQHKTVPVYAL